MPEQDQNSANNSKNVQEAVASATQDEQSSQPQQGYVPQTTNSTTVYQPPESEQMQVKPAKASVFSRIPVKPLLALFFILALLMVLAVVISRFTGTKLPDFFGKKGEIVWWGFWQDESVVRPLIEKYENQNPKVTIKYVAQSPVDYRERLSNALARGEGPDIFRYHNSWVPMFSNQLDTMPSDVMTQAEFQQVYYPVIVSDLVTTEGIVGIPLGYDALTLFVNQDILVVAGKTQPSTWDEVRELAKQLTSRSEQGAIIQAGIPMGITQNVDHWEEIVALMIYQNKANPATPDLKKAGDAILYFKVFADEDGVWDSSLPNSTTAFASEKVALYFGPSYRANEISKANPNLRYRTAPLPQLRKDDPQDPDVSYATYWVEGVWQKSANKENAWDFLKFLSTKESLQTLYKNLESKGVVGEPYPRMDMSDLLIDHPIAGSVVALAPRAKSWYLASDINDGPTGINSKLSETYKKAINSIKSVERLEGIIDSLSQEVQKILRQYGIRAN